MSRVRADPITAALAHPTRRNVYTALISVDEMSTVQLQNLVDVDRYNLYHHLKKLASLELIENHRDSGRARWWRVAKKVDLPEILSVTHRAVKPHSNNGPSVDLDHENTHFISLEGSRDRWCKVAARTVSKRVGYQIRIALEFCSRKISLDW